MKRFAVLPFLLLALACGDTPTSVSPDDLALAADHHGNKVVLLVNGGARADIQPAFGGTVFPEGTMVNWSFTVRQTLSGEVSGNFHYNLAKAVDLIVDMSIDCLALVGNTAYIGGTILRPEGFAGVEGVYKVTDNGEGSAAPPDMVSDVVFLWYLRSAAGLPEGTCVDPEIQVAHDEAMADGSFLPLTAGNVQIIDKR